MAVTKNFVWSPHCDNKDVAHQYVASFGRWDAVGGKLAVESETPGEVYVVDTRDRVARVDGRHAHWVRGYVPEPGSARYSLVFYTTAQEAATERRWAVDVGYAQEVGGSEA